MEPSERKFRVFVSYHVLRATGGMMKFGNLVVVVDAKRNKNGYLPDNITDHMAWQIRAQIAVEEKVDEELIYIANMYILENPPKVGKGEDNGSVQAG